MSGKITYRSSTRTSSRVFHQESGGPSGPPSTQRSVMKHARMYAVGAVLAVASTALVGCSGGASPDAGKEGRGPITFAQGKDTTGKLQTIIDDWNDEHPDEKVTFVELPESANDQRTALVQDFQAGAGTYDVAGLDVVWTAEFAARDWLVPLDGVDTSGLFESTVDSGTYDGKLYAAPYNTNAGFLYYRTDLIDTPPTTWAELEGDCAVAVTAGIDCYAGQFAQYEGLTVNFSEAVNSAGGTVIDDGGNVTLDTPEAKAGLQFLVDGFENGTIPDEAVTYQEEEGRRAFQAGKLLFLRNWPYVYGLATQDGADSVVQDKIGIAPLPGADSPGASTLGGYNLAISKASKNQETAKDFITYMESEGVQKKLLTDLSLPPVRSALYDDAELQKQVPYLATLKEALENAVPRPKAVSYNELSTLISENVYKALQGAINGNVSVDETLSKLQDGLQKIVDSQ
ncbi:ABC transporter substrate-binding protein [Luethyella okanaganae]|uniref:ABC transporter substrate-binding protein n=1 Tax=Luethyella okanaganae TaxID=69372 RepID=A0ABW1VDC9_9MICO